MSGPPAVEIEDLHYRYPGGPAALRGVSLVVAAGEMVAMVGQNGAGKSTLARHLNGLLRPAAGRVRIFGRDTARLRVSELARYVGYVFQNPDHQIFRETVAAEVAFGPANLGCPPDEIEARVHAALRFVNLEEKRDANPHLLSRGERQRVALASVLAMQTPVLVLDEPTTGQDYRTSLEIMERVAELNRAGHTVIFITHDMELVARYASRVVVLARGKVVADGGVRETFASPGVLAASHLAPPDITCLAREMAPWGIPGDVLTVEEMLAVLAPLVGGRGC
ncbi:MAG: ABC transporter ATP-binding protein [Bacillota bacterium]